MQPNTGADKTSKSKDIVTHSATTVNEVSKSESVSKHVKSP